VEWLTHGFEAHLRALVKAGLMDAKTLKQRSAFYSRLRADYGQKAMEMPRHIVVKIRDDLTATPGAADNMVKAIRALYAWAKEQGHVADNPAEGIGKINRGTGAKAWTVQDMKQFRARHPIGTTAHLALTLFMFTACRIEDVVKLGRGNEATRDGITALSWQPSKRGSAPVSVPILPPLAKAIAAQKIVGPAYLLTEYGKPFASGAAFGNKFRKWCAEAGLTDCTPHGIRKAAGELMAIEGASQYHIMAVHGHTQAKTSEIYTKGVDRARLAAEAMQMLAGMEW
jgi:integrase